MADPCINACDSVVINATGAVQIPDSGYLQGFVVNASTGGTLTLTDGRRTILPATPVSAGQYVVLFGMRYAGGLTATIGGTSATVTLTYAS